MMESTAFVAKAMASPLESKASVAFLYASVVLLWISVAMPMSSVMEMNISDPSSARTAIKQVRSGSDSTH